MNSYTLDHKYGRCTRQQEQPGAQILQFFGLFNKTNIPLALVEYVVVKANSALRFSLPIVSYLTVSYPTRNHGIIVKYNSFAPVLNLSPTTTNLSLINQLINQLITYYNHAEPGIPPLIFNGFICD